MYFLASHSIHH